MTTEEIDEETSYWQGVNARRLQANPISGVIIGEQYIHGQRRVWVKMSRDYADQVAARVPDARITDSHGTFFIYNLIAVDIAEDDIFFPVTREIELSRHVIAYPNDWGWMTRRQRVMATLARLRLGTWQWPVACAAGVGAGLSDSPAALLLVPLLFLLGYVPDRRRDMNWDELQAILEDKHEGVGNSKRPSAPNMSPGNPQPPPSSHGIGTLGDG